MLKAKVREDSRFSPIISCSGVSFFRDSWVNVPPGFEVEAKACEFLTTKEFKDEAVKVVNVTEPVIENEPEVVEVLGTDKPIATDEAIKLAHDMKVNLGWITGTGKDGKILVKDIETYLTNVSGEVRE